MMTGCANEAPFTEPSATVTGKLMTRCLAPKLGNTMGNEMSTRAGVPSVDDFWVVITREGQQKEASSEGSVECLYSDLPEVLTLPVGDYNVSAHHGENPDFDWESPFYYGESAFGIDANKITDDVDPIIAKLSNIRVTITFHPSLLSAMSDGVVEVNAGSSGKATFSPSETRSAYFKYVDQSQTLVATFTGTVEGESVVESIAYDNVAPGNHYKITFRVRGIEDDNPGTVNGGVTVDTTVEQNDLDRTIDGESDEPLNPDDYDDRPVQGGDGDPSNPDDPTPDLPKPYATALEPSGDYAGFDMINLNVVNEVTDHLYCAWKVISEAEGGFTTFTVDINSNTLTPEELDGVGLTDHLDLINPGEFKEALEGLGFPTEIGGWTEAEFNITGFLSLMAVLGSGTHEFKMTVSDANGTSVIYLRLHTN